MTIRWILPLLFGAAALSAVAQEDVIRPQGRPGEAPKKRARSSSSSTPWRLGVELGGSYNMFSQDLTWDIPRPTSPEQVLESGSGISPYINLVVDLPISSSIGFRGRVGFDMRSFSNEESGGIDVVINNQFIDTTGTVNASYEFTMNTIDLAFLLRFDITPALSVTAGTVALIRMGDVERKDEVTITGPDGAFLTTNYRLEPGQYNSIDRTIGRNTNILPNALLTSGDPTLVDATSKDWKSSLIGVELGVGYAIDASPTVSIEPHLRFQYFLTPMSDAFQAFDISRVTGMGEPTPIITFENATLMSLQLGVSVLFDM